MAEAKCYHCKGKLKKHPNDYTYELRTTNPEGVIHIEKFCSPSCIIKELLDNYF